MEGNGCSQRWRMHSKWLNPATENRNQDKTESKNKEEANKNVTIASTSRYLTDRRYVSRRPLTSEEQHVSILKGSHPQNVTEKVRKRKKKVLLNHTFVSLEVMMVHFLTCELSAWAPWCENNSLCAVNKMQFASKRAKLLSLTIKLCCWSTVKRRKTTVFRIKAPFFLSFRNYIPNTNIGTILPKANSCSWISFHSKTLCRFRLL